MALVVHGDTVPVTEEPLGFPWVLVGSLVITFAAGLLVGHLIRPRKSEAPVACDLDKVIAAWGFLRVGRPTDSPGDVAAMVPAVPGAPFPPAGGGETPGGPGGAGARKLKLSAILDPTLDADIQGMTAEEIAQCYNAYKAKFGDFPSPESDVSADQLGALRQVLQSGSVPFADFSVFGPHGTRRLRKQTFTGYHLNVATGEWSKRELPGPGDFHSWYQTWKCYRTGLLLLEAAQAEHLDAYSE